MFKYDQDRAIQIEGLDEADRYAMQHFLNYQMHNPNYPHIEGQHGRAAELRKVCRSTSPDALLKEIA
jgi:hypothetical protein